MDRRGHIGGNAYDRYDAAGVLIHPYGPHYFRTNSDRVLEYLSQFTEWHPVEYRVQSYTDGQYWSFPINLATFEQWIGREASEEEFERYLKEKRVPIENPRNSEDVIISQVGWEFYEKFFLGYTLKHWKKHPRELDASVCGRIPIRTSRDDRYLREKFQALPQEGYSRLFENMVAASPGIKIRLETDYRDVRDKVQYDHMVYTGAADAFFEYEYGRLPYRSLRFENESFSKEALVAREPISKKKGFWQPAMQVNYPNDYDFTRVASSPGHPFYEELERVLREEEFDSFVESKCSPYYAKKQGRPSIPPGVYFRMLLIGYFERIDSERGICWRCSDSLSLRQFLGLGMEERTPDHSSLSRIRNRLPLEVHESVFGWVLEVLGREG